MNLENLRSSFLGSSIPVSSCRRRNYENCFAIRGKDSAVSRCSLLPQNQDKHVWSKFSRANLPITTFLLGNLSSRSWSKTKCMGESFSRSKALIRSFRPLWKEGLFLIRCSMFVAVLSTVGLLLWYGHFKTRSFVEKHLLPSVCSILSEHLERDINFGKVRGISPLGITLESCSIGPHREEFSCAELPTVKIRVRPFASVRRGKIVVDAVLSKPNVLVAQKEDFSWLGIPPPSDHVSQRLSSEEGIDFRTKTRRMARENGASESAKERAQLAKDFSKLGYVIPMRYSKPASGEGLKDSVHSPFKSLNPSSFFCADDHLHWGDHHSMDMGIEYGLKHEELERSFGIKKSSRSWLKFWPRAESGFRRHKFKREAHKKISAELLFLSKLRILERSAVAAQAYFNNHGRNGIYDSAVYMLNGNGEHQYQVTAMKDQVEICVDREETKKSNKDCIEDMSGKSSAFGRDSSGAADLFGSIYLPFILIAKKLTGLSTPDDGGSFPNKRVGSTLKKPLNMTSSVSAIHGGNLGEVHGNGIRDSTKSFSVIDDLPSQRSTEGFLDKYFSGQLQKWRASMNSKGDDERDEISGGMDAVRTESVERMLPVTLDSLHFSGGSLMLLGFGDQEPREMEYVDGHVKFQNHYSRIHVQLSGSCMEWRSDLMSRDGGYLSTDVFVDTIEQNWHANLKIVNLFAPLFERILDIPIRWSNGRATGEVHLCMSRGETFPDLHGQLDVSDLGFQIVDAPSSFSGVKASLCFRGQRIFLHNASGMFGHAPLEASGDFGINPDDGEFHLMCQVPCVEVNDLMKTLKMKPLLFSLAGSVTAVFNCQGPLDAPIFVGSGMVSRKTPYSDGNSLLSPASEAVLKNKEAGCVAAFDRIPFSHVSANFTFNTDNCVADLYGIRGMLLDGGEIRGAGNAWICPEGEVDDSAMDVNLSGTVLFDKAIYRYLPNSHPVPLKIGELHGETKLSGSLLKPRFDIKWSAPNAEDSFSDARGNIIIAHEHTIVNSSSVAFDLYMKVQTVYGNDPLLERGHLDFRRAMPLIVEGVDLDLRMRGFEFANFIPSMSFDSPRPMHLKATGRIKFQGRVAKPKNLVGEKELAENHEAFDDKVNLEQSRRLVGEISMSGIKLNQLILAPQLAGSFSVSSTRMKLDAVGRPDENFSILVCGPLLVGAEDATQNRKLVSLSIQKGQLRASIFYQPEHSANIEVRNLPLDELELASLRGTIQRAELQLNFQKRRGHGVLSVLHPKFSGVLGEALDVAARWSGDVITVEKAVLEQAVSHYELQGEYVLPGTRDRYSSNKESGRIFGKAVAGQLGNIISSMGRWRIRLEVPRAEVFEMLPLARLLSRSTDPAVRSRSKDYFIQNLQQMGFSAETLRGLFEEIQNHHWSDDVSSEDIPGLSELQGSWRGSLDASGGGNGDTMAEFDFHGEDWVWGTYRTQRVLAAGAYSNNDGLRLEKIFIQKDKATLHADGTLLGPITNLHFAVLNFPIGLVPTVFQIIEVAATDSVRSLCQMLSPIKGVLHMEGDLRGSLAKPECDVQVRLLDGVVGGIDLGRAEIVASLTPTSRFLFNAKFEPVVQSGHVHIQGSVPLSYNYSQVENVEEDDRESDPRGPMSSWMQDEARGLVDKTSKKNIVRERTEEGWDVQLAESLRGLNWNLLEDGEVRIDADVKDGGMMLITALSPHATWLHGYADVTLQVRGTVEQPVLDGSASFHRASVSSPVLPQPLTNLGGTVLIESNRLCISSMESRVSGKGKVIVKGNLPLNASELYHTDKIDLKCEKLKVQAKNIMSGRVDCQMQISGSILQPNISGKIQLSHGEAYIPHDKRDGETLKTVASKGSSFSAGSYSILNTSGNVSRFFGSETTSSVKKLPRSLGKMTETEKGIEQVQTTPGVDVRLTDLKLLLGPYLKIVYPLFLNFAVSGEVELNGMASPKWIRPKGTLTFETGEVDLVATQVRLKREHRNIAKFEPDLGLDPILDLALVGSEWQFKVQSRASNWQDSLVVTSLRSVDQDVLSPTEAARVFESELAESLLEGDGQLAFQKLATAALGKLMPRIEGKGEFGHARWRLVYAPQIPSMLSVEPTADPLKSIANNISFGAEVEVQLGKHLQASVLRQMKDSEMAMQCTLIYKLTSRLRVLFQSSPSPRLLFEYSASSQD
ncbi:embryo defective 2410 [Wolffia australiana]